MTSLRLALEPVIQLEDDIIEYRDTICELSRHEQSTFAIVDELIKAVIAKEKMWRDIEHREDYKAQYTCRAKARDFFLREEVKRS